MFFQDSKEINYLRVNQCHCTLQKINWELLLNFLSSIIEHVWIMWCHFCINWYPWGSTFYWSNPLDQFISALLAVIEVSGNICRLDITRDFFTILPDWSQVIVTWNWVAGDLFSQHWLPLVLYISFIFTMVLCNASRPLYG